MINIRIPIFRFNKKRKHPSYIFKKKGDDYYSLLITHSSGDKKRKNIPLYKNPNPNDCKKAYVQKHIYKDNERDYDRVLYNWLFDKNDKRLIKKLKKKLK